MARSRVAAFVVLALVFAAPLAGCVPNAERTPLSVFCAGSLMIPFYALETAYEAEYPGVDVQIEAHGSIQVIRHVTDIHEEIDVVATADHALLPMLMYVTNDPDTGRPYGNWYAKFATNRMALAYTDSSRYAEEITPENWHEILRRPDVRVGLSDPRFDASGYRTLMLFRLAEDVYGQRTFFTDMLMGQFTTPIRVIEQGGVSRVHVPEILTPRDSARIVLRGSSIQLIALLQSGDIDYAMEYESVIAQHGLRSVAMPDALSFGSEAQRDAYAKVAVKLDFRRFASVDPEFVGEAIGYGVTIPSNAPHPNEAIRFVAFLLGPEGQRIMAEHSHPELVPALADGYANMPERIKELCAEGP